MKNLRFVALLVSIMLVLAVGTASADFTAGEGDTRYDNAQDAKGPTVSSTEISSGSGGSGGLVVDLEDSEIARFPNESLRFRLD